MFLAPWLYVIHAVFTGVSLAVSAWLPVREGFGFSGGLIDLVLNWVNPLAQNPWLLPVMGLCWFVVYFVVFRFVILRFRLNTPGREEDEEPEAAAEGDDRFAETAARFVTALGGRDNIVELDNCATRLRMQVADVSLVDDAALKRAGAAGTMKPGGGAVQVVYGLNVQFVKDAMERVLSGAAVPVSTAAAPADAAPADAPADAPVDAPADAEPHRVLTLRQPIAGEVHPLSDVPDPTFGEGVMGPGLAIEPAEGLVVAPAPGVVAHLTKTNHAIAMVLGDDVELLIHVGIDTVELGGRGFEPLVEAGETVEAGTPLLRFDLDVIREAGHPTITPVVVLNDERAEVRFSG
jgi:PTS system N-acetylglucosamine-specific IIC component